MSIVFGDTAACLRIEIDGGIAGNIMKSAADYAAAIEHERPVIVQSDRTVLLETSGPLFEEARSFLSSFAEIEKTPEYVHTFRISPLSLWNAASLHVGTDHIIGGLRKYSRYPLPQNVERSIVNHMSRYGKVKLVSENGGLFVVSEDNSMMEEVMTDAGMRPYILGPPESGRLPVMADRRGHIKQALFSIGYPAEDLAGYTDGEFLEIALREATLSGDRFMLRPYQTDSADAFYAGGAVSGGSGIIALPCGAGKTAVGMAIMAKTRRSTLVICPNNIGVSQWLEELLDKTTLTREQIGIYTGERKEIGQVTLTTYQILTWRKGEEEPFPHFDIFRKREWGLIIYDEVHLLPAPVFSITAELQGVRRLGLTATLVREDGREKDVFTLIGPKKYDVPWRILEKQGWIATVACHEYRTGFGSDDERMAYATAPAKRKFGIAARNRKKLSIMEELVLRHGEERILIIGDYLDQMHEAAAKMGVPLITGKMPEKKREEFYRMFRDGAIRVLAVTKVANFALNLPEASVAIQISGTFGSRQEEAQRIGRILRPKSSGRQASFYTVVTKDTVETDFAANREMFMTEQGYTYRIADA